MYNVMGSDIYEKIKDKICHLLVESDIKFSFGNGLVVTAKTEWIVFLYYTGFNL